jgi:3-oxoacyl-[acyl-carrier protein] reductase
MKFKNKVVLITGSNTGIGKATALEFAKEGAKLVINYLESDEKANMVVSEIKKIGSEAISFKGDVSDENQVKIMIENVIERFGKIDILVNNAGIVFDTPFLDKTIDEWKNTLSTNLIGTFLCSKYASKYMPCGSKIVNISSTNGINSFNPHSMDYDASKAGVIILTRDLAKELAPKIRVNSIAPGWVDTAMNKDLSKEFADIESNKVYLKRFARPEEIAKAVLFLASDDSSYVNGITLMVDGGYG